MKLYEIQDEIRQLLEQVDEDGVLSDEAYKKFLELKVTEDIKIENTALYYKNVLSDAKAIKNEEETLYARRQALENHADRLKDYLAMSLNGQKFESAKVKISYRKSEGVLIDDEDLIPLDYREPQPDKIKKAEIKKAIKAGKLVNGAKIEERQNIQIK